MTQNLHDLLETRQELANAITHGIGLLLVIVAIPILLALAAPTATTGQLISLAVFSLSMLAVYTSSTIYHAVGDPFTKEIFQQIDHICIYLLIAGTNTPVVLYFLNNTIGYIYLAVMWSIVLIGMIYKIFFINRLPILSLVVYTIMGWMGIVILYIAWNDIPSQVIWWLVLGGVSYSIGIVFYQWERLPYNHAYWHLFVIGGTVGHYLAVVGMV
ncbi:MAG: hemolysin III family protein [Saprospiraceae bacterium]